MFRQEASSARSVWSGGGRYCILPSGRSLRLYIFRASDEVNDETRLLSRVSGLMQKVFFIWTVERVFGGHTVGIASALASLDVLIC